MLLESTKPLIFTETLIALPVLALAKVAFALPLIVEVSVLNKPLMALVPLKVATVVVS